MKSVVALAVFAILAIVCFQVRLRPTENSREAGLARRRLAFCRDIPGVSTR